MNHNYNKNNVKTKGLDPPKPITVQSYKISQRQKWKCCQAWRLIWVSETYRDILLYLWGAAFPLCCCDLFFVCFLSAAFPMRLGDKSVARSLPPCTVWAPALKLAVDPADLWAPRWRETKSVFEILACSHLPRFVIASNPTQPSYTSVSVRPHPTSPTQSDGQPSAKTHQGHSSCTAHELKIRSQDTRLVACRTVVSMFLSMF